MSRHLCLQLKMKNSSDERAVFIISQSEKSISHYGFGMKGWTQKAGQLLLIAKNCWVLHATQKPMKTHERLLITSAKENDLTFAFAFLY